EIFTDKLPVQPEEIYVFRKVLAIHSEGNSILGTPCVEGAPVFETLNILIKTMLTKQVWRVLKFPFIVGISCVKRTIFYGWC
ncbi:MAG: hypothetical protein Q8835_03425, partial [Sweet potato little leaf phytoplasma]|nr:hypothetical protein [Sweet potato little leaf phytoplasma]